MAIRPVIRDYSEPTIGRSPKKAVKRSARLTVILIALSGFSIGAFILFAKSPWFYMQEIHIRGLEFIPEAQVRASIDAVLEEKVYGMFTLRHRLFMKPEKVKRALEEQFAFDSVEVGQRSAALEVEVHERPTGVIVTDGKKSVFTDLQGIVIRDAEPGESEMIGKPDTSLPFLLIFEESALDAKPGDRMFAADFLEFYRSLQLHFEVETGLPVHQYVLPRPNATWMKAKLADTREIYIDMTRDIEPQVQKLLTLMKTKGNTLDTAAYIDLRFPDRIYFKAR